MLKGTVLTMFVASLSCAGAFAQTSTTGNGPCSVQSSKLACVLPEQYGTNGAFNEVLHPVGGHAFHFINDFNNTLEPLTEDIGRQANLIPLASPSSGVILVYDPSLKTLVTGSDSLGPVLGERAETVGRHHLFVGFSYQFFNFNKLDGVNLLNFPTVLTHTDDNRDNSTATNIVNCSINTTLNLNGCAFVRDRIDSVNSISLKESQYTTYVTFGLLKNLDLSIVIPIEDVRLDVVSQDSIVLGSNGFEAISPGTPDASAKNQNQTNTNGAPYFFHLFKNCPNTSPAGGAGALDPSCLNHTFPDPSFTDAGSAPKNAANGLGDIVTRVKWNAWEGEHAGFAAGMDVRFPTGDALDYLGSGSYGFKPFALFSYRWIVSPHALIGYEWNSDSITAGSLLSNVKGKVPNDFVYTVGADARFTKWLTGAFDIVGQRVFGSETVAITNQQFLANCGACTANPTPATVTQQSLQTTPNVDYNITSASLGLKARPFHSFSKLVFTANVLLRLDDGGLRSKAAPLVGVGYTF